MQVNDTGSLSVNQYGWINIWTAILGQFFARFPVFFDFGLTLLIFLLEIFPDGGDNVRNYLLLFTPVLGIKRGARLVSV
ncbi:hypothetical protein A8A57_17455 [Lelliottia amnigena]|nr:hypothetical protein A8A57_17455 [Lelliottia amnigena]